VNFLKPEGNGLVARGESSPTASRFYTYRDLAELWRVKEQTIRVWFMQLRRAGMGPKQGQCFIVQRNAALRVLLIRADYVVFVQQLKVERMK
jgi:hypothetical protein